MPRARSHWLHRGDHWGCGPGELGDRICSISPHRECTPMRCPEELRAEVRRLHLMLRTTLDPAARRDLAAQALELAQQAEAIESLPDDVEGLRLRIAQYRHMLDRADNEPKQRVVAQLLRDAERKLQRISNQQSPPRQHRSAVA